MRTSLKQDPTNCPNCPLHRVTERPYIKTEIFHNCDPKDITIDVLFVGEAPGPDETRMCTPFVGEGGSLLRQTIEKYGNGLSYALAYVTRCSARDAKGAYRAPNNVELNFCHGYVRADITQLRPKVIVLLGATALATLNPDKKEESWVAGKIKTARTKGVKEVNGIKYLCTLHPMGVVHNVNEKVLFVGDILRAFNAARGILQDTSKIGVSHLIQTKEQLLWLRDRILALGPEDTVAMDTETLNLNRVAHNAVLTWQFAWSDDEAWVVPYEHPESQLDLEFTRGVLQEIFSAPSKFAYWVMHNGPFDVDKVQRFLGIYKLAKPVFDTMFGMYMLDENRTRLGSPDYFPFGLKVLASELLDFHHYDKEILVDRAAGKLHLKKLKDLSDYGGMDAYVTKRLADKELELAGKYASKLLKFMLFWFSRVMHMSPCIERAGIYVDKKQLKLLQGENSPITMRLDEIEAEFYALDEVKKSNELLVGKDARTAGMTSLFGKKKSTWLFDIDKRDHRLALFFDYLKLEPVSVGEPDKKYLEGVPSVDKKFYQQYEKSVVAAALLSEQAGLKKLKTSYANSVHKFLTEHPDMKIDGRLRSSQLWTRTVTGRTAQQSPNSAQLPRPDKKHKKEIKSMLRAYAMRLLIEADYSQAEIRWWAQIAGDQEYAKVFRRMNDLRLELKANPHNEALRKQVSLYCDVHKQAASEMFRVDINAVTKEQRQAVKNLVFGSLYGQSIKALASILKISETEAQELLNSFLFKYKHAGQWLFDIEAQAERTHFVETPCGRRRHLEQELTSKEKGQRNAGKRMARNSPIQAQSSDMMNLSACELQDYVKENDKPWLLNNLVHDAILFEIPLDFEVVKEACVVIEQKMTGLETLRRDFGLNIILPFEIELKMGTRLGHLEVIDNEEDMYEAIKKWQTEDTSFLEVV